MLERSGELIRGRQRPTGSDSPSDRVFPWEVAAVLVFSLVCLLPYYRLPPADADEGLITAGAERILRGQIPYRDFFSELGPATFYLQALLFKVMGVNATTVRLTAWLLGGAITVLVFLLARKLMPGFRAFLAASIIPLYVCPLDYRVDHHWWGNFFLLLLMLWILRSFPRPSAGVRAGGRAALFLGGVLAALTLLSMQTKGFWSVAMTGAFLMLQPWLGERRNWRDGLHQGGRQTAWFLAGVGACLISVASYFYCHGAARAWIEDNFFFLLANYWTYGVDVPQASALRTLLHLGHLALTQWSVHFNLYFINTVFFLLLAPAAAFGGTAWQLFNSRRSVNSEGRILLFFLLEGVGAFLSEYHAHDEYHLISAAPLMLILLVYQWDTLAARGGGFGLLAKGAALMALAVMLVGSARKANAALQVSSPVETRRGVVYARSSSAGDLRKVIEAIQQRVPRGDETFVYPYVAELYFYTATRNPTRFEALLPEFHSAAQIEEAIARLMDARPRYVFSFEKIQRWTVRPHFPDDPPDAVLPHPVRKALATPGSGYHLEEVFASGYSTGQGQWAEVEVWAADQ
jgi:hypothetical protein